MNVFMPYANTEDSVQALDDKRLCKQILECMQVIRIIKRIHHNPFDKIGYCKHPIVQYYKSNYNVLICYAYDCCLEYSFRYGKAHAYEKEIYDLFFSLPKSLYVFTPATIFYHEGKDVREYEPNASMELFQKKLIKKWLNDLLNNRKPKWHDRCTPHFFISYINTHYSELEELGQDNELFMNYINQFKEN